MHYLITGGLGFIGSHLAKLLLEQGHAVTILDDVSLGKRERLPEGASLVEADICDFAAIRLAFEGIDGVFHLAADPRLPYSMEHPESTHAINVDGTHNILLACKKAGVQKVVFSSSSAVYGDQEEMPISESAPLNYKSPYALHKLIAEQYMQLYARIYSVSSISLRYFNVYGPGQSVADSYASVIPFFLSQKAAGKALTITGTGEQTRDYIHVRDVALANIAAMQSDMRGGEVFNIGTGNATSVNDLAQLISDDITYLPERPGDILHSVADVSKAKESLGWAPTIAFEEGMRALMGEE